MVRWSQGDAELLGIDRDAEAANTAAAGDGGVGAEVVEYRPDLSMLVISFLPGPVAGERRLRRSGVLGAGRRATRALHAGPRFQGDFDMFARQAAYLATVQERGYALPPGYTDHADAWEAVRRALAVRAAADACPATTTCSPRTSSTTATRCRLIDYEYSGNNDACFELGNTATECDFTPEQVEAYAEAYFGDPTRPTWPGCGCRCWSASTAGRCGASSRPPPARSTTTSTGWGMDRFEKSVATFRGPDLARLLEEVAAWLTCPLARRS